MDKSYSLLVNARWVAFRQMSSGKTVKNSWFGCGRCDAVERHETSLALVKGAGGPKKP